MRFPSALGSLLLTATLVGCNKAPAPSEPPTPATTTALPASAAATTALPDHWLGRWQGPETTFLEITGTAGAYRVTVQNLDGPRTFDAMAGANSLSFTRDGVPETIRAGSGADTGMKWLADKRDCLVVKAGEGYCRG